MLGVGPGVLSARESQFSSIKSIFNEEFSSLSRTHENFGLSVGVVSLGRSEFLSLGRDSKGNSINKKSIFLMNSMTKVFTGTLLARLHIDGKIHLNDVIALGSVKDVGLENVSYLDLATHTSGLPRLPDNLVSTDRNDSYRNYTEDLFLDYLNRRKQNSRELSSRGYLYSNLGFGLLGYLMAKEQGTSFAKLIEQKIFQPLKMSQSFVSSGKDERALPGFLSNGEEVPTRSGPEVMQASWAVYSTAEDMIKFLRESLDPSSSSHGKAVDVAQHEYRDYGKDLSAGLGWSINKQNGTRFKNGSSGGYHSIMMFNRSTGTALVLLSNTDFKDKRILESKAWRLFNTL